MTEMGHKLTSISQHIWFLWKRIPSGGSLCALFVALLTVLSTACNPNGSTITNNYLTANGSDKKLPEDGGYKGTGGTGDGGGGQGILCSQETKNSQFRSKLFVRDIFEALYVAKLKLKTPMLMTAPTENLTTADFKYFIEVLHSYFGHSLLYMDIGTVEFWQDFVSKISFIDDEAKLYPSRDANSPIVLPSGCAIVQIAFWDDSEAAGENGQLYVDKSLWVKLDTTNKLALLAHEYFFKQARAAGYKNSDSVRARLGKLFSTGGLPPMMNAWNPSKNKGSENILPNNLTNYKFCRGHVSDEPRSKINAILHDENKLVISALESKNISISSLQALNFTVGGEVLAAFNLLQLKSLLDRDNFNTSIFSPEVEDAIDFWMRESSISSKYDKTTSLGWRDSLIQSLTNAPNYIWQGTVSNQLSTIQIALENPLSIDTKKLEDVSHEPSAQIFSILENYLMRTNMNEDERYPGGAAVGAAPYDWQRDKVLPNPKYVKLSDAELKIEVLNAIAILNHEVASYIASGSYPGKYPKWEQAISTLSEKVVSPFTLNNLDVYKSRVNIYPELLHKAKLGILTVEQKEKIEAHLVKPKVNKSYSLKNGKVIVTKDSHSVAFDITCEDAGRIYNENLPQSILKIQKDQTASIHFTIDYSKFNEDQAQLKGKVTRMLNLLSGRSSTKYPLSVGEWKHFEQSKLIGPGSNEFESRLKKTALINISPCSSYSPYFELIDLIKNSENSVAASCFAISFEDKSSYLVQEKESSGEVIDIMTKIITHNYRVRAITPPENRVLVEDLEDSSLYP